MLDWHSLATTLPEPSQPPHQPNRSRRNSQHGPPQMRYQPHRSLPPRGSRAHSQPSGCQNRISRRGLLYRHKLRCKCHVRSNLHDKPAVRLICPFHFLPVISLFSLTLFLRSKYKTSRIEWDVDECAQPLSEMPRQPHLCAPNSIPLRQQRVTTPNRFQVLASNEE